MKFSLAVAFAALSSNFATAQDLNIPATAEQNGSFTTLVTALGLANLTDTLAEGGPFTVFAPTDAAFDGLPDGLLDCLVLPENTGALSDILLYHVVSGELLAEDLADEDTVESLFEGQTISVDTSGVILNGVSTVVIADVEASNGVIHAIESVLVPPSLDIPAFLDTCPPPPPTLNIPETAVAAGTFGTLVAALGAVNLTDTLAGDGPFTVFAPDDDAFAALPEGLLDCLLEPEAAGVLTDILLYHVVEASIASTDLLPDGGSTPTLLPEQSITYEIDGVVTLNNEAATVTDVDIAATNGFIHIIDAVLVPESIDVPTFLEACQATPTPTDAPTAVVTPAPTIDVSAAPTIALLDIPDTAEENGSFMTLLAALSAANLTSALSAPNGPFTVLAPTDDAFAALPEGLVGCLVDPEYVEVLEDILLYHVISGAVFSTDLEDGQVAPTLGGLNVTFEVGREVVINEAATVALADVAASNGVIHVLDAVLVPPGVDVPAFLEVCTATPMPTGAPTVAPKDIVEVAEENGNFATLLTALSAVGLDSALGEPNGPFTVFAPTDEAFGDVPAELLECLLLPEYAGVLSDILLYHVTEGTVLSTDLEDDMMAVMLNNDTITIDLTDGVVINNSSSVSIADVTASNGVIHVIDTVLVPADVDVAAFLAMCSATMAPTGAPTVPSVSSPTDAPDVTTPTDAPVLPPGGAADPPTASPVESSSSVVQFSSLIAAAIALTVFAM